jgi:hypothetical protein
LPTLAGVITGFRPVFAISCHCPEGDAPYSTMPGRTQSKCGIVEPMRRIEQAAEGLDCPRSLANSAATLWHPEGTNPVKMRFRMPERRRRVGQRAWAIQPLRRLFDPVAEAENPQGIVEPMRRIEQAAEGLDCPRSLANSGAIQHDAGTNPVKMRFRMPERRRRVGQRAWAIQPLTGFVPASCCMAHRLPGSGRISRTPA